MDVARVGGDRGDKIAFTALLALIWLASAWWALEQAQYIVGVEGTLYINRMVFCLLVYGVFIAYYTWRSFKPAHWDLSDHEGYVHLSTVDLPGFWSLSMARYKRMVEERRRREA